VNDKLEELRERLPAVAGKITQVIADNPAAFGVAIAAGIVAASAAHNIVKPKTVLELIALQVVLQAAAPFAVNWAIENGFVRLRVRDKNNKLVPFKPEKLKAVR
jgi:hypothetical protein